jgi:hypothetical protein
MGGLNGGGAGFDVHRHEDDRVELLRDHRVELFLLDQCVIAAVEHGQLDLRRS